MPSNIRTLPAVTVATAGTKVQVSSTYKPCSMIRLEADTGNTGNIFVGDLNVSSSRYTAKLAAGAALVLTGSAIDITRLYVDASANAQKVQVSYSL